MFISLLIYLLLTPTIQAESGVETTSSVFNVSVYPNAVPSEIETVTIIDVDATATTFHYPCMASDAFEFLAPTNLWPPGSKPRPTPFEITATVFTCNWYSFTQGPSTWAMSFNNQNISYSGTCTMVNNLGVCTSNYGYHSTALGNGGGGVEWNENQRTLFATVDPTLTFPYPSTKTPTSTPTPTPTASSGIAGSLARPTGAIFDFEIGGAAMLAVVLAM